MKMLNLRSFMCTNLRIKNDFNDLIKLLALSLALLQKTLVK